MRYLALIVGTGLVASVLLGGCAPTVYRSAEQVTAASTVYRDDYAKYTSIKAPLIGYPGPHTNYDVRRAECFLRTVVTDSGARTDQLYLVYVAGDWSFLNRAHDRSGRSLDVIMIDRDIGYSHIEEDVAIVLDDAYLRNAALYGIDIQVAGDRGATTVRVPAHYVKGFLIKLDQFLIEPRIGGLGNKTNTLTPS